MTGLCARSRLAAPRRGFRLSRNRPRLEFAGRIGRGAVIRQRPAGCSANRPDEACRMASHAVGNTSPFSAIRSLKPRTREASGFGDRSTHCHQSTHHLGSTWHKSPHRRRSRRDALTRSGPGWERVARPVRQRCSRHDASGGELADTLTVLPVANSADRDRRSRPSAPARRRTSTSLSLPGEMPNLPKIVVRRHPWQRTLAPSDADLKRRNPSRCQGHQRPRRCVKRVDELANGLFANNR